MSQSPPPAPDYAGAAEAQGASSREAIEQQNWANRPTINTPFGQQSWSVTPQWDPTSGQYLNTWEQNTNLTPEAQAALDAQMGLQQGRSNLAGSLLTRAQQEYGQPMDWGQFDELANTPESQNYSPEELQRGLSTEGLQNVDPSQRYAKNAEDAIYGQWAQRHDPEFKRQENSLQQDLYNKGLREGDEAYDQEMRKLRESQGDQRTAAQYQATIGSGAEAARYHGMDTATRGQQFGERSATGTFRNAASNQALQQQLAVGGARSGQDYQAANYENQLRQQQIAEEMQKRGFSLNEINAIISGQQVGMPSMPGFSNAGSAQPVQYNQAAQSQGQAQMDAFNAQQQQLQGLMQGGAMMFSDRALKKNIIQWAYLPALGLWEYFFNYIWESDIHPFHRGFMADEVEKLYPDAVINFAGFKVVDYARI